MPNPIANAAVRDLEDALALPLPSSIKAHLYRLQDMLQSIAEITPLHEGSSTYAFRKYLTKAQDSLDAPTLDSPLADKAEVEAVLQAAAVYQIAHADYHRVAGTDHLYERGRWNLMQEALMDLRTKASDATLDATHGQVAAHSHARVMGSTGATFHVTDVDGTTRTWHWPPRHLQ